MFEPSETHKYDDIIDLPHHTSVTHPRMPVINRAAQFAPFAALTGYDAAIKETGRLTREKVLLDEDAKLRLSARLSALRDDKDGEVTVTYFVPDKRKSGGEYVTLTGAVKKVDEYRQCLSMCGGVEIPFDAILQIDGEQFEDDGFW